MPNLKRIGDLYRRFPFTTATRWAVSEAVRSLVDPHRQACYGTAAEDVLTRWYLNAGKPGFYVDVGCNHPIKASNTAVLYSYGWIGLVVDGNASLIEEFRRVRPRDTAVCALVSDRPQDVQFSIATDDAISTFDPDRAKGINGYTSSVVTMRTQTLQSIFERENVPKRFELLSIDVEGQDFQAISSFSLDEYRPRVIVAEILEFDIARAADFPTYRYLTKHGYSLKSFAVMSGIFIDERS